MLFFNHKNTSDAKFDDIINEIACFAKAYGEHSVMENKDERLLNLNKAIAAYCCEGTRMEKEFEAKGLEAFKSPKVNKNRDVRANFDAVLTETINVIVPAVVSEAYKQYLAEVRNIGWGDTAVFTVKSNELFQVNEIAEGINRGVLQPMYDTQYTVNTKTVEIAQSIDWYQMAAGVIDLGEFGWKAAKSFEQYIMTKIIAAMTSATDLMGPAYSANGFTNANWNALAELVSAANGGAPVYGLGTLAALGQVMPSVVGLQYGLGEEIAKVGHLNKFLGVELIPVDQAVDGRTINTTGKLLIPSDIIFLVAGEANKPAKVVFEGDSTVLEEYPELTSDKTYGIRIQMKIGVSAIVGSKFGTIKLA